MGLEHVDDPVQLMYPEIGAPDGLAAGDLNGLQALGKAPCRKDLWAGSLHRPGVSSHQSPRTASASSTRVHQEDPLLHRPAGARLCSMGQAGNRRSQCSPPTSTMGVMVSGAP